MDRNGVNLWLDRSWAIFKCVIATFVSRREKNLMFAMTSGLLIFFAISEVVAVIRANRASLCPPPLKRGLFSKIYQHDTNTHQQLDGRKVVATECSDISHNCKHCNFIRMNDRNSLRRCRVVCEVYHARIKQLKAPQRRASERGAAELHLRCHSQFSDNCHV